jgi:hypothetical protein
MIVLLLFGLGRVAAVFEKTRFKTVKDVGCPAVREVDVPSVEFLHVLRAMKQPTANLLDQCDVAFGGIRVQTNLLEFSADVGSEFLVPVGRRTRAGERFVAAKEARQTRVFKPVLAHVIGRLVPLTRVESPGGPCCNVLTIDFTGVAAAEFAA